MQRFSHRVVTHIAIPWRRNPWSGWYRGWGVVGLVPNKDAMRLRSNNALESGRTEARRVLGLFLRRRAAQRER